jgi:hypothetical protein
MNVTELNPQTSKSTLARFFEATLPLTFFTIWIIVAFQSRFVLRDNNGGRWKKFLWPIKFFNEINPWATKPDEDDGPAYEMPPTSATSVKW